MQIVLIEDRLIIFRGQWVGPFHQLQLDPDRLGNFTLWKKYINKKDLWDWEFYMLHIILTLYKLWAIPSFQNSYFKIKSIF